MRHNHLNTRTHATITTALLTATCLAACQNTTPPTTTTTNQNHNTETSTTSAPVTDSAENIITVHNTHLKGQSVLEGSVTTTDHITIPIPAGMTFITKHKRAKTPDAEQETTTTQSTSTPQTRTASLNSPHDLHPNIGIQHAQLTTPQPTTTPTSTVSPTQPPPATPTAQPHVTVTITVTQDAPAPAAPVQPLTPVNPVQPIAPANPEPHHTPQPVGVAIREGALLGTLQITPAVRKRLEKNQATSTVAASQLRHLETLSGEIHTPAAGRFTYTNNSITIHTRTLAVTANISATHFMRLSGPNPTGTALVPTPLGTNKIDCTLVTVSARNDGSTATCYLPAGIASAPGSNTTLTLKYLNQPNALVVPMNAVHLSDDGRNYHVSVRNRNHTEQRPVIVGRNNGITQHILTGLTPGDVITTQP